jgi:cell division protein FtsW
MGRRTKPARADRTRTRAAKRARDSQPSRRRHVAAEVATPAGSPRLAALDGGIAGSTALLAALGLVMMAMGSALPPLFLRHLAALCLALGIVTAALKTPLVFWRRLAVPLWVVSVLLLVATLLVGIEANGAQRWLAVPGLGLSMQASELAKWSTSVCIAGVLAAGRPRGLPTLRTCLLLAAIPAGLLLLQPDLGNAFLLLTLTGGLLFVGGVPIRRLGLLGLIGLGGVVAYVAARPYALSRWKGYLAPWQNARSEGFQLVQSFVAFGRGGSFGVGLGDGRQKLEYLPEAHTDFILSVVAEELGLVGVLIVLGLFAAVAVAGVRVALRAREPFAQLLAFAMTTFLALPAAVNAAVVMGLLPTTGFTLPFLSFGSNSLLVCALSVGVLLRVASEQAPPRPLGRRR